MNLPYESASAHSTGHAGGVGFLSKLNSSPLLFDKLCLANGTMLNVSLMTDHSRGSVCIGVETFKDRGGMYNFSYGMSPNKNHVAEKLRLPVGDAANMADFISSQINLDRNVFNSQGDYSDNLLGDEGNRNELII